MPLWDPELDVLRPETVAFNADIQARIETMIPTELMGAVAARAMRREGKGLLPGPVLLESAEDLMAGDIPIRVLRASNPRGVYLHIHGGGWALGGADYQDEALQAISQITGCTAVSVEYRLAPEHPYPAGADDCETAALWLLEHFRDFDSPERVVIGGESAGAHLALVTMIRLRDRHKALGPLVGANLVYGAYDLSGTPSFRSWTANLILSPGFLAWSLEGFLPGLTPEERRHPDISPLYADLAGLPPALLSIGTLDPLLDDSLFLHERFRAAGVESELAVYPDAIHAFDAFPTRMSERANQRMLEWISSRI